MTQVHIEATKAFINGFDIEALDPETKAVNPVSGQDNLYYNIGVFYQLGSPCRSGSLQCGVRTGSAGYSRATEGRRAGAQRQRVGPVRHPVRPVRPS